MIVPDRISIIWPYWMRGEAMLRGLESMHKLYGACTYTEIVIVDDGSPEDSAIGAIQGRLGLNIRVNDGRSHEYDGNLDSLHLRVIELPRKTEPKNPCVPINVGVAASTGEFVVITNPENTHRAPILSAMRDEIVKRGRDTYVLAAAWCPETSSWHCHSVAASAGYHFMTMLHRELWDKAGGFDEEYRDGFAFDDPDWVQRLLRVGAKFIFRDDLIVDHHKEGATHSQPQEMWGRNHDLYWRKWPNPKCVGGEPMTNERLQNWS